MQFKQQPKHFRFHSSEFINHEHRKQGKTTNIGMTNESNKKIKRLLHGAVKRVMK